MDVSLLIRLVDQASAPAKKIAGALGGIREKANEFKRGFNGAIREGFSVSNIEAATKNAETALNNARGRLLGAFGMAMTLAAPIVKAGQFDQSMRGLDKVLDVTESRLGQLRKFALDTSALIPIAASELVELMSEAAQGGVPESDLEAFTTYVANAAVAFDMAGGVIGERFAKLRNVYKLNQEGIEDLGDATNHLSNNMAAKASELTDFTNRAAGAAAIFRLSATETTAVGASMIAAGIVPETAARGFTALATRILSGGKKIDQAFRSVGMNREAFLKSMETDAPAALIQLFQTLAEKPEGMEALIELVGRDFADDFAKLLGNPELLAQALGLVADKTAYAGSAVEEAAKQAEGAEKKWDLLVGKLMRMAIILGDRLLPEVLKLADHLGQLVDRFSEFAAANPELTGAIVKTIAALMAFSIGARLIAFAVAAVRLPLVKLLGFFLKFNEAGRNVALGWRIISGSIRGVGSAAGLARRGVEGLISKVGGLPNALRAGLAASWVIPLAFEFFDDMGRTPEERLEQIRQNQAAFKKLEEDVEQSSFGKLWKSVKDWSNEQMGMEAGAVPAEVLLARITEGWGEVEKWYAQATIDVDKWAADLFDATSGFAVDALNGTLAGLTEGWTQLETWVQSKVEWLKNAFSFEFKMPSLPSWITGGSPEDAAAQKRSAAISGRAATANAADAGQSAGGGAFDQMLAGMDRAASQASDGLARGGTAVEQGGQKAATALEQGAAQSAAMLKEAARAIGNAASRLSAQPGRASAGGSVGSSIATARTGALHGGTE
ncbi:phage tail tape measure protein [Nitratireductor aquimarinus]|uniref:phage tail tape measure protein n=1 Tax=Nitratireductor aquimarinus TaxID=889300 RepID=UPI001A8D30BD|nr:phage tail tape measure protein [Nitratireductor aquimarinus]MBN8243322.1 phage tail tape measure protein [Nitratireductor aquimarinus]MBY6131223.1 phage tail tape measure protein [Nitratireductor aquimarinus]MCA1302021.1 phage tail tape measure protein [Nitratireductor aquimarinus]